MANRITAVAAAAMIAGAGLLSGIAAPQVAFAESATNGWQCAQFARLLSGIEIFGDAYTWWRQAIGKYARGNAPEVGAVLVFKPHGAMKLGHVAVVSQVVTDRVIQVTHANWSRIDGTRGQVEKDVTVQDVSAANDWSEVKVWNNPTKELGTTVYPTYGFVYKGGEKAGANATANARNDASDAISRILSGGDSTQR
jgi:surface antigen